MTLPPLPPTMPPASLITIEEIGHRAYSARDLQTYAEQYGRLCTEASTAELDRLQERVAELEADAERLDWLFENYSSLLCTHQGMAPKVTFQPCLLNKDFAPAMLRAAIDTARKAKP